MNCSVCRTSVNTSNNTIKLFRHRHSNNIQKVISEDDGIKIEEVTYDSFDTNNSDLDHYNCFNDIRDNIRICTCNKMPNKIPTQLTSMCVCNDSTITKMLFPFENYEEFLIHYNDDYYLLNCCRGCSFSKEMIEKDITKGIFSCMVNCVFKKKEDGTFEYISDVIDEDFIEYARGTPIFDYFGFTNIQEI